MNITGTNSRLRSEPAGKSAFSASEILPALTDTAFVPGCKSPTKRAVEEREVTISRGIQWTDGLKQNQLVW